MSRAKASFCVIAATIVTVMALFFSPEPTPLLLRTAAVVRAPLQQTCMLQGTVSNADTRYLISPCAGLVKEVYVQAGEEIKQQELLLRLDTTAEEEALSELQKQRHMTDGYIRPLGSGLMATIADKMLDWETSNAQLLSLIEAKQIRADENGVVGNLYVQPGQYVNQGTLLGETCSTDLCITALWTGDRSDSPKPGMEAWWCSDKGTALGKLLLDSVAVISESPQLALQLCFSFVNDDALPDVGSKMPVRLLLDTLSDTAQIPLEAVADDGSLWLVRGDRLCREEVVYGKSNHESIQVPDRLTGLRVLLEPGSVAYAEGSRVKHGEAM